MVRSDPRGSEETPTPTRYSHDEMQTMAVNTAQATLFGQALVRDRDLSLVRHPVQVGDTSGGKKRLGRITLP